MNNGLYSNSSGRIGRKKIAGFVGKNISAIQPSIFISNAAFVPVLNVAVTSGVRTRLASVNANGAVLFAGVGHGAGSGSITVELVIDGEVINKAVATVSSNSDGILVAGYATYNAGDVYPVPIQTLFDYIPFDSNAELWVTTSGITNVKYSFLAELYK